MASDADADADADGRAGSAPGSPRVNGVDLDGPAVGRRKAKRVVILAVGGPTCSGKTTLSKHLRGILPESIILHQDDFAPPSDMIPLHPVHEVQDWDDPRGAVEWDRMRSCLRYIREHHRLPPGHSSHDDLNIQAGVPIPSSLVEEWRDRFASLTAPPPSPPSKGKRKAAFSPPRADGGTVSPVEDGVEVEAEALFVIVDGFLLYWDEDVVSQYDLKFFVRESYSVLKHRREVRQTYHTADQYDCPDGLTWRDPPSYWDNIVWPAFRLAHRHAFVDGDVEEGEPDGSNWAGKDLVMLQPKEGEDGMAQTVEAALQRIWDFCAPPDRPEAAEDKGAKTKKPRTRGAAD